MGKKWPKQRKRDAARAKAIAQNNQNNGKEDRMSNVERVTARASAFGSNLVHLGLTWAVVAGLVLVASHSRANPQSELDGYTIPQATLSAWTEYPNPLNITDQDREQFHPVVIFPKVWMDVSDEQGAAKEKRREKVANYQVHDHTTSLAAAQLASEEERQARRQGKSRRLEAKDDYAVGRYDENRVNLYASELFRDPSNAIDGFAGIRTVHIGLDLGGPVRTKVYAFTGGVVHSSGYNAELGDYGNVIVIEHDLGSVGDVDGDTRKVWALYGHLDDTSIKGKQKGQKIKKGQVIGRFGDIHENGGW
jgi:murein DD-endopeptidase MepM/ murein hydrolase activator NlpD